MSLKIVHLFERSEHLTTVASWIHNEWWTEKPGHPVETMVTRLREASNPKAIPLSLIALDGETPVGTVNLVESDNDERPDLTPWLAALLVLPEYRDRGFGKALVQELAIQAKGLGVSRMFLGTDIPEYYARLGANMVDVGDEAYCIMAMDLA